MNQQEIRAKCQEVFAVATQKYKMDFTGIHIRFDLSGRAMGMAGYRMGQYYLRFNMDMMQRASEEDQLNTITHEIAHTVCQKNPMYGRRHDAGWQSVHISLGGSARRTHDNEVVYAKGRTFEYTTTTGHKLRLSETRHKRFQAVWQRGGAAVRMRDRSKGVVNGTSPYVIVGHQGRTLATPIQPVRSAAVRPVAAIQRVTATPVRAVQPSLVVIATGTWSEKARQMMGYGKPAVPSYSPAVTPAPVAHAPLVDGSSGSKAAVSRHIMQRGHANGLSQEQIIQEMISANGYSRQLARATYKANQDKAGVPELV